jgi:hypothetical protein
MAELFLGNVDASISDDDVKDLLMRYGFPAFDTIERVPGSGTRPAVLLCFHDLSLDALRRLQPRIHNLFWKNRTLSAQVMMEREE